MIARDESLARGRRRCRRSRSIARPMQGRRGPGVLAVGVPGPAGQLACAAKPSRTLRRRRRSASPLALLPRPLQGRGVSWLTGSLGVAGTVPFDSAVAPESAVGRDAQEAPWRRSRRPTRSGASSSPPSSTRSPARRAPSGRSPASTSTPRTTAPTAASPAATSSSAPTPSSTPAPAGRASSSRRQRRRRDPPRQQPLHAPHRGRLRPLRFAPRSRLRGRPRPDRPALLHQLLCPGARLRGHPKLLTRRGIRAAVWERHTVHSPLRRYDCAALASSRPVLSPALDRGAAVDQRLRDRDRAVLLLAVLDDRDQRAADGDRGAVQRVDGLGRPPSAR